jgi:hypothetical protein
MASQLDRRITTAIAVLQGATALAVLRWGQTGPIPMQFDWSGAVNRYGTREEAAIIVAGMALLTLLGPTLMPALSRRRLDGPGDFRDATLMLIGVTSLVCALEACLAFRLMMPSQSPLGLMSAISAILAVVGAYLGRVGPNALVGVRTPWTIASRLAWDKANRLAGRLFFWAGLAGFMAAPFAPQPMGLQAVTVVVLVIAGLAVYESWRVWRIDPDRTGAI